MLQLLVTSCSTESQEVVQWCKIDFDKIKQRKIVDPSEDEVLDCLDQPGSEVLECIITFAEKPAVPFHHLALSCPFRAQLTQDKKQQSPLSEQG